MTNLTAKQAAFCREYIVDSNGTQAAIRAGYSEKTAQEQASQMLALPHIDGEVKRLQAKAVEAINITIADVFQIFFDAVEIARRKESSTGMIQAGIAISKLKGWWIEVTEDLVARAKMEADITRIAQGNEFKTAGGLLADAAESLGLPRNATPDQIVGATTERPYPTPEVFALLRAARVTEDAAG